MSFISPVATDTNGNAKATGSQQTLGKDDFLQLLVTKLQNQDPLNPSDDEQFISELAQFSSLEQMSNIADNIETLGQYSLLQMQSTTNATAANLIGKDVKAEYDGVYLETSGSAAISYTTTDAASEITFTIKDSDGNTVTTITAKDVSAGANTIKWDGTDSTGNRVAAGYYTVTATGTKQGSTTAITPTLSVAGTVSKVIYRDGTAYVCVDGLQIPLSDITSIGDEGTIS